MTKNILKLHLLRREIIAIATAFVIMTLGAAALIAGVSLQQRERNIENTEYFLESEINKLQYAIDSRILAIRILEVMVISMDGQDLPFDEVASMLYEGDDAVRSLQLAPDGIIQYVYPLEGNEQAFLDLFHDDFRREDAEWSRDTGNMTFSGPYELAQGGMGVVARKPFYLENGAGEKDFWGFGTVVLNVPEIFDRANLDLLSDQSLYYRIWRRVPDTGEIQAIAENTDLPLDTAVRGEIKVPNGVWYLSLQPQVGWVSRKRVVTEGIVSLIIVTLGSLTLAGIMIALRQHQELEHQAVTDSLTGIHNGRYYLDQLKELTASKTPFVLFYLDMNNFKKINDTYGHDAGDEVLKTVAARIQECIEEQDIAARIGGDEFTITLLKNGNEELCSAMAQLLKQTVAQPMQLGKELFYPDISVGWACCPGDSDKMEDVIRLADQRMYCEKRASKQCRCEREEP